MTNKMGKTVIIGSILCSLVLIGVLSTFAYIILSPTETKEDLGVETGSLSLTFADGNNGITEALKFGGSVEKTFSIQNSGSLDAIARIMWDDLVNTYLEGSLTYSLSSSDAETGTYTNVVENQNVPTSLSSTKELLAGNLSIPTGSTKYYKLTITLNYLDDVDQTADLKASLSTHFSLEESDGKDLLLSGPIKKTIKRIGKSIKNDNLNFAEPATTNESADGLYTLEDDYGTSYYYRGAVEDNYVKFGTWSENTYRGYEQSVSSTRYKDYVSLEDCKNASSYSSNCQASPIRGEPMYWRIIRINGDGSVRLIYDGTSAHANNDTSPDRVVRRSQKFNTKVNDAKYVGYMFGGENGSGTSNKRINLGEEGYEDSTNAIYNETSSEIKSVLESWYVANIKNKNLDEYVADSVFCYDRSMPGKDLTGDSSDTGLGYGNNYTSYGAYQRSGVQTINYNKVQPKFTCENRTDAFTRDDTHVGNGALSEKIGLITADEAIAAGSGKYTTQNTSYYLYKGELYYWTGSPYDYSGNAHIFYIGNIINYSSLNNASASLVPVISLTPEYFNTLIGDGTMGNPYREKGVEP